MAKWYAVWVGRVPGVYSNWASCAEQVMGYSGAKYKGFDDRDEAYRAFRNNLPKSAQKAKTPVKSQPESLPERSRRGRLGDTLKGREHEPAGPHLRPSFGQRNESVLILHMQLSLDQLVIKLRVFRRDNPDWKSPDLKKFKGKVYQPNHS